MVEPNAPLAQISHFMGQFRIWSWANAKLKPYTAPDNLKGEGSEDYVGQKPLKQGRRRVSLGDYGQALDALMVKAAHRNVGVIIMQPANRVRLEGF